MGLSEEDREVATAKESIVNIGVVPAILDLQNEDGSWGRPERFYTDKYRGTVWNLIILAEMRADPKNEKVKKACEFILRNSQESELGVSHIPEVQRLYPDCPAVLYLVLQAIWPTRL